MNTENTNQVVVTNINMPFLNMVLFMVKWTIATLPAVLIIGTLGAIVAGVGFSLIGG